MIFYPMFAMFLLTPVVLVVMFRARVRAIRDKHIPFKYFRAMSGGEPPEYAQVPARHFVNLFELPILFYVACLAAMIMEATGPLMVGLAWSFVALRYAQALIHLTYNNIFHRMFAYFGGMLVLVAMWLLLLLRAT